MAEKKLRDRINRIFTEAESERLMFFFDGEGNVTVNADVHGMGCVEAKAFLKNVIAVFRNSFTLVVIHGCNRGTAIRDMVRRESLSSKVVRMSRPVWNDGVTEMRVRALCA